MADPVVDTKVVDTTTQPTTTWVDPLEPEIKGHLQTRGWDKLDPGKAVTEAVKFAQAAEKAQGIPVAEIARIPADPNDAAGWAALHTRLGVPDNKAAYALADLKFADGEALDEAFTERMRGIAHDAKLRPDQATKVVSEFMKFLDETDTTDQAAQKRVAEQELEKLKVNWGPNFDLNNQVVDRAAKRLNIAPEQLKTLAQVTGAAATFEMLLSLGVAMGEARYISGSNPQGAGGVMSAEQAVARKAELARDTSFLDRYSKGETAAIDEMNNLDYIIVRARHASR